ncbi:hypothetical protein ABPG75_004790 [Micractinium tetrahymenae]
MRSQCVHSVRGLCPCTALQRVVPCLTAAPSTDAVQDWDEDEFGLGEALGHEEKNWLQDVIVQHISKLPFAPRVLFVHAAGVARWFGRAGGQCSAHVCRCRH